jgi:hypothetical protein
MKTIYKFISTAIILFFINNANAQNIFPSAGSAGIGTTTPNASSLLEMVSTTKGMLAPRMTKNQRDAIATPATGLLIYQTNSTPGFYYYDGTSWKPVSTVSANKTLGNLTSPTAINTALLPNATNTIDLGSALLRWNSINCNTLNIKSSNSGIADFDGGNSMFVRLLENGVYRGYLGSYSGNAADVDFGTGNSNFTGSVNLTIGTIPKLTINSSGNVGVGITSPNAKLDVAGDIRLNDNKIYLRSGSDGFHSLGFDATVNGPMLSGFGGGGLGGPGPNTTVLRWTWDGTTGNVGIGTNTPYYKLDVCGTMRAKEVRVETGWCDYVFADDYRLPSLKDVEAYIKANRHLPGVTAGSVIEKDGLELGKTSEQMIKKIEELTLYVIDLQKQVDMLKKSDK